VFPRDFGSVTLNVVFKMSLRRAGAAVELCLATLLPRRLVVRASWPRPTATRYSRYLRCVGSEGLPVAYMYSN